MDILNYPSCKHTIGLSQTSIEQHIKCLTKLTFDQVKELIEIMRTLSRE